MQLPPLAADAGIHCMPIPTPFAVGRVNCYLIEDEPLTLLDTGPNSGKALDELEQALAKLGRKVEDIELVVLSHQHMDHLGLAGIVARRSGAEGAALEALAPWAAAYGPNMAADDEFAEAIMARHGIPQEVRHALRAVAGGFRAWGAPVPVRAGPAFAPGAPRARSRARSTRATSSPCATPRCACITGQATRRATPSSSTR